MLPQRNCFQLMPSPVCNVNCEYCSRGDNLCSKTEMTSGSNLCPTVEQDCHYCVANPPPIDKSLIVPPFPLEIIDYVLSSYEIRQVTISGIGETCLCPNLLDVISCCSKYQVNNFNVITNGIAKPLDWYRDFLSKIKRTINLIVSYHMHLNSLDRIIELVNLCRGNNVQINPSVIMVASTKNIEQVIREVNKMNESIQNLIQINLNLQEPQNFADLKNKILSETKIPNSRIEDGCVSIDGRFLSIHHQNIILAKLEENTVTVIDRDFNWNDTILRQFPVSP